ncbi:uncharacterized protein LOC143212850 [Lasioglossum baleicum]|uniref:uncharacterized protein LOC143212850 n=1 Tax=Lasioglossum baleicum TaxID=434251 RepID=UPI003FCC6116
MTKKDLQCDILHIFQNRDFSVLQSLVSYLYNYHANIAANVDTAIHYENESKKERALRLNQISESQQKIARLKSETDETRLELKKVDKRIANASKQSAILTEKVDNAKTKRDNMSLEIIDLNQEREKCTENKILKWNAIKHACYIYKEHLDIRISLLEPKEHERVQISFFIHNVDLNDKYFVCLTNSNDHWKVEEIRPTLKKEHFNDFKGIISSSGELEIVDITAFLYKLRHTFVKNYLNAK